MTGQPLITVEIDYDRLAEAIARRIAPPAAEPDDEFWSTREVARALHVHRKSVYGIVNKPGFPKPRYFTKERRWKSKEVLAWADSQHTTAEAG